MDDEDFSDQEENEEEEVAEDEEEEIDIYPDEDEEDEEEETEAQDVEIEPEILEILEQPEEEVIVECEEETKTDIHPKKSKAKKSCTKQQKDKKKREMMKVQMQDMREQVVQYIVSEGRSQNNSKVIETAIYNATLRRFKELTKQDELDKIYFEIAYNVIGKLRVKNNKELNDKEIILEELHKNNKELSDKEIIEELRKNTLFFDSSSFCDCHVKEQELNSSYQISYVTEDGVYQCSKCNSKKTYSYQLQTRSADEPMTNFVTCLGCQHRWKF